MHANYLTLFSTSQSAVAGHPRVSKAAVFDIITPDLTNGPIAASAEVLALINDCLHSFPTLADNYEVHISHSKSNYISSLATLTTDLSFQL